MSKRNSTVGKKLNKMNRHRLVVSKRKSVLIIFSSYCSTTVFLSMQSRPLRKKGKKQQQRSQKMWWTHEQETVSSHEHGNREKQAQKGGFGILAEGSGQMLLEIRSSAGMWDHPLHLGRGLHSLAGHMHKPTAQLAYLLPLRCVLIFRWSSSM